MCDILKLGIKLKLNLNFGTKKNSLNNHKFNLSKLFFTEMVKY